MRNIRNIQNFQSLPNRQNGNSSFSSAENWREREIFLLSETGPKNTKYNTKWAVNVFTAWQNTRMNKTAQLETSGGNGLESTNVEDLSVPLEHMSADSLNIWLCKFICECEKQTGERYPPKTLYLFVCGINRHLGNVRGEKAFNMGK